MEEDEMKYSVKRYVCIELECNVYAMKQNPTKKRTIQSPRSKSMANFDVWNRIASYEAYSPDKTICEELRKR